MCIIVDANKMGISLADPVREEVKPIHDWLARQGGKLVYSTGSQFAKEVGRGTKQKLLAYVRAGRAKQVPVEDIEEEEKLLRKNPIVGSNDPHILALARFSGARVLYTSDKDLSADFKKKKLIDGPRGRIYTRPANAGLLTQLPCP